jgi:predicted dienelactone hydrolase
MTVGTLLHRTLIPSLWLMGMLLLSCGGSGTRSDAGDGRDLDSEEQASDMDVSEDEGDPEPGDLDEISDGIESDPVEELQDAAEDIPDEEEIAHPILPPDVPGPYSVGVRTLRRWSGELSKWIDFRVWYPAVDPPSGSTPVTYLLVMRGHAYEDLAVHPAAVSCSLVLFSHGNKGINFQSYTFTEHLASHGFFVAAPDHTGNTIFDSPSDSEMARIALERPADVAFVYDQVVAMAGDPFDPFFAAVDGEAVGVSGHSFGGYTALVLSGATVDVDAAAARCDGGTPADVFCPYIPYWPPGTVMERPARMDVIQAGLALAPGGYAAFGDEGLAAVTIPVMIFGGTLDEWTPLEHEIRPIYDALGSPSWKVEIERAGHMSFTDICRIPGSMLIPELADMCDPAVYINLDRAFYITNAFATAFFRYHLLGEEAMDVYLAEGFASTFGDIEFAVK